jgi:hypothetical protein
MKSDFFINENFKMEVIEKRDIKVLFVWINKVSRNSMQKT